MNRWEGNRRVETTLEMFLLHWFQGQAGASHHLKWLSDTIPRLTIHRYRDWHPHLKSNRHLFFFDRKTFNAKQMGYVPRLFSLFTLSPGGRLVMLSSRLCWGKRMWLLYSRVMKFNFKYFCEDSFLEVMVLFQKWQQELHRWPCLKADQPAIKGLERIHETHVLVTVCCWCSSYWKRQQFLPPQWHDPHGTVQTPSPDWSQTRVRKDVTHRARGQATNAVTGRWRLPLRADHQKSKDNSPIATVYLLPCTQNLFIHLFPQSAYSTLLILVTLSQHFHKNAEIHH